MNYDDSIYLIIYLVVQAVQWINLITTLAQSSVDARDTSVQIFDKFLFQSSLDGNQLVENAKFVSLAAAASALVSTKIHDSCKSLKTASFPYFKPSELINFERDLLALIKYEISPSHTPVSFVRYMLCVWPLGHPKHLALSNEANRLISAFWLSLDSTLYTPFTIAVSALLLAFFRLDIDSSDWLKCLPECCLAKISSSLCLDVDACLQSFKLNYAPISPLAIPSPSSLSTDDTTCSKRFVSPTTISGVFATENLFVPIHNENLQFYASNDHVEH